MEALRICAVALSFSTACLAQSAREIAQRAFKSVVLLELDDSQGQPIALGSGFFVATGVIATNQHVIDGASSGTAKLVGDSREMELLGTIAVDRQNDLALLKVDSPAPPLRLESGLNPAVGDAVYVVGNPLGLEGTFSEGIVSGIRTVGPDTILQMTAPISPGSSGGPVMDGSGAVIGIAEATFRDGQNLNLAVPASALNQLWSTVSQHLQVTPLSAAAHTSDNSHSVIDSIGTRIEAGVAISDVKLTQSFLGYPFTGFEFRITNKSPVAISHTTLRIIYRDAANGVMDFEDFRWDPSIPPGMTKTVATDNTEEATRAMKYYDAHGTDGTELPPATYENSYNALVEKMKPRIEVRVVSFDTEAE
jgi:hypothetical protein